MTFTASASGFIARAFQNSERLTLEDDLSVGPLSGLKTAAGRQRRARWWHTVLSAESFEWRPDDAPILQSLLSKKWEGVHYLCWYGPNAEERLGLCRFAAHLPPGAQVSTVFLNRTLPNHPLAIGECPPSMAKVLFQDRVLLSAADLKKLKAQWQNTSRAKSDVRVWQGQGPIVKWSQKDFDTHLIRLGAKNKKMPSPRIHGLALLEKGLPSSNMWFVKWRIADLRKRR